jgi:U3 small nucleolar RNA-associated protein 3
LKAAGTSNIRNHPVIGALVELRGTIEKMEKLATKLEPELEHFIEHLDEPVNISTDKTASLSNKNKKASSKKAAKQVVDRESDEEDDGADLYSDNDDFFDNDDEDDQNADSIEQEFKSLKKQANKRKRAVSDNDFGDLDMMEEVDMEDKLAKKRSIRDYVAKIETVSRDKYSMKQA